jgi:hypothetical protein
MPRRKRWEEVIHPLRRSPPTEDETWARPRAIGWIFATLAVYVVALIVLYMLGVGLYLLAGVPGG